MTDTRDMNCARELFRWTLADVRGQVPFVLDGDTDTAEAMPDYLHDVFWLLHAHHSGEDELL